MTIRKFVVLPLLAVLILASARAADKPKLTLDEFFNYVGFTDVKLAPDGQSVVIATGRADWDQNIFRDDLWVYRDNGHGAGSLTQLTNSGHDSNPQWSPDGRWIVFLSERGGAKGGRSCEEASTNGRVAQLYVISLSGGEAFQ
jgi:dipeptidyl aminopeptidase/acylaminoacyl peptidase